MSVHVCTLGSCECVQVCICVCMYICMVGLCVDAGAHKLETSGLGPWQAAVQRAKREKLEQTGAGRTQGSLWEKNSLKTGTPLKSPQSPQVWLAYLRSSSSWKERTRRTPGPPGTSRTEECGSLAPHRGAEGCSEETPHTPRSREPKQGPVLEETSMGPILRGHEGQGLTFPLTFTQSAFPLWGGCGLQCPDLRPTRLTHQEAVVLVPHEDQAQPGHHLQVAGAALDQDPGLAERQPNPVERGPAEA